MSEILAFFWRGSDLCVYLKGKKRGLMHTLHFSLKNLVWRLVSAVAVGFIFRVDATVGTEFACPGLMDRLVQ